METIQIKNKKEHDQLRALLIREQGNLCLVTGKEMQSPCLDHDHKTGLCRGMIENGINRLLPERDAVRYGVPLEDLPTVLRQMADYLERESTQYLHVSCAEKPHIVQKASYEKLRKKMIEAKLKGERVPRMPEYVYKKRKGKKDQPYQKMTKPLARLFGRFKIEPKFYAR